MAALGPDEVERFKRRVSLAHMRRVRHRSTFGILAVNLDKRGVTDYIDPSTFAEIAMAAAFNKRVYLLGGYPPHGFLRRHLTLLNLAVHRGHCCAPIGGQCSMPIDILLPINRS
jgi:hypothetical protein